MREFFVYIVASPSRTTYTGVTNNLERRIWEHKTRLNQGFASKLDRLVYAEAFSSIVDAVAREKQLKDWRRARKIRLIEMQNPGWADLGKGWYEEKGSGTHRAPV